MSKYVVQELAKSSLKESEEAAGGWHDEDGVEPFDDVNLAIDRADRMVSWAKDHYANGGSLFFFYRVVERKDKVVYDPRAKRRSRRAPRRVQTRK
jgi:hypothetical protein